MTEDDSTKENSEYRDPNSVHSPTSQSPLLSRALHPQPWCGQHQGGNENVTKNVYNYCNQEEKEKTPMCQIAELARYHKLKHEYKLMDESGPAHKKLFTVQLHLTPDQIFEGSGASIKKAQQEAARVALEGTTLSRPPDKSKKNRKDAANPVVLLGHVCRRLGAADPIYQNIMQPRGPRPRLQYNGAPHPQMISSMLAHPPRMMNGNGWNAGTIPPQTLPTQAPPPPVPPIPPNYGMFSPGDRYVMLVTAAGTIATGSGPTPMAAKANAAAQALFYLAPAIKQLEARLKSEDKLKSERERDKSDKGRDAALEKAKDPVPAAVTGNGNESGNGSQRSTDSVSPAAVDGDASPEGAAPTIPKHRQKSVISQVHECALQMKMNVELEMLLEEGLPHERTYVMRCALRTEKGEIFVEETGEGRKKKEATQIACQNVLNWLSHIENSPIYIASTLYKSQKKQLTQKEPKRKTIVKDMKMDPGYGHQINPVSRLIQVLQARGESDPRFELIGEHGQSRYKEFQVQVECGDLKCVGSGPNKRLAKRAAAESLLSEIGFVKPLPPPGKSLLKRKEPQMEIGFFDMNELLNSVPAENTEVVDKPSESIDTSSEKAFDRNEKSSAIKWDMSVETGAITSPSPSDASIHSPGSQGVPPSPGSKRRVTFNNQVCACPPPDDENYPQPELAPLKADIVVEGRMKRMRRSKEGKRSLTEDQRVELLELVSMFLKKHNENLAIFGDSTDEMLDCGHQFLETLSKQYKFSVQYTNFPKSPDGNNHDYFALVTLGLEKPLVCHGSGNEVESAAENAAMNAIAALQNLQPSSSAASNPARPSTPQLVEPTASE